MEEKDRWTTGAKDERPGLRLAAEASTSQKPFLTEKIKGRLPNSDTESRPLGGAREAGVLAAQGRNSARLWEEWLLLQSKEPTKPHRPEAQTLPGGRGPADPPARGRSAGGMQSP